MQQIRWWLGLQARTLGKLAALSRSLTWQKWREEGMGGREGEERSGVKEGVASSPHSFEA